MNKSYTRSKRRKAKTSRTMTSADIHGLPQMDLASMFEMSVNMHIPRYHDHHRPHDPRFTHHPHHPRHPHHPHHPHDDDGYGDYVDEEDELDDDQPPMTRELDNLMRQIPVEQHPYVYDVYNYELEAMKRPFFKNLTENTLRVGVISPMLFGRAQQNDQILSWAVTRDLLPTTWRSEDVIQKDIDETMRTIVEIADTFVQCLLRTEPLNLIKISYHIGEWYNFSNSRASHNMQRNYSLEGLKRDMQEMCLLPSVCYIYADNPEQLIWHIAVFVCHQYFFYLVDNEYKKHNLLADIEDETLDETAAALKDEGNELYKAQNYTDAIRKYGEALRHSPYNHLLYSNRAMSYLKLKDAEYADRPIMANKYAYSAMCDAFRCTKLFPLYAKGHDRYAMALAALNRPKQAGEALKAAIQTMEKSMADIKDIKTLKKRLEQYAEPVKQTKKKTDGEKSAGAKSKDSRDATHVSSKDPKVAPSKDAKLLSSDTTKTLANSDLRNSKDNLDSKVTLDTSTKPKLVKENSKGKTAKTNGEGASAQPNDKQSFTRNENVKQSNGSQAMGSPRTSEKSRKAKDASKQAATKAKQMAEVKPEDEAEMKAVQAAEEDLSHTLRTGSAALLEERYKFAINLYDRCFKIIQGFAAEKLGRTVDDIMLLRYARGVAYVCYGPNEEMVLGIKELRHILEQQPSQTMKAITLYELGIAYRKQHRFQDALESANEGMKLCLTKKGLRNAYCWPGTDTFIQHTDVTLLKEKLTLLLNDCKNPPLPDFRCRADLTLCLSYGHISSSIYIDDPDFRGYVCICCTEKCLLHYHRECWKKKHLKINATCITPDCGGIIFKHTEYDEQMQKCQEERSDKCPSRAVKSRKPALKIPKSSQRRIEEYLAKKVKKMEIRAENRKQAVTAESDRKESENLADQILASSEKKEGPMAEAAPHQPHLRSSSFVIKHKKREDEAEQERLTRKPAKKVKGKQTMTLEEFCGPTNYEDTASTFSSGSLGIDPANYFAQHQQTHEREATLPVVIQGISVERLTETVAEFYYEFLESKGPMVANSKEMLELIEHEAAANELLEMSGGLTMFLLKTGRFFLIENIICILRDTDIKRATQLASAARTVAHGVSVVSHDFKANLERASAYVPERKKYSGYENNAMSYIEAPDLTGKEPAWREVVEDWKNADRIELDDISVEDGESGTSLSTSGEGLPDMDGQPIKVEKLSPTLLEAWKKAQEKSLIDSLNNKATEDDSPRADSDSSDQLARHTSSVDSVASERNTSSVNSDRSAQHCPSPGSSSNSKVTTSSSLLGYVDFAQVHPQVTQNTIDAPGLFMPRPYIPTYTPILPIASLPVAPLAPIGTPAATGSLYMSNSAFGLPYCTPVPAADVPPIGGSLWAPANGPVPHPQRSSWPRNETQMKESQTDGTGTCDKQSNTDYEYMNDYDKKMEECRMLHERNKDLADKLTQLKQTSSVENQELQRKLTDALQCEKETRLKAEKTLQTCEKETRRWKEEKRVAGDEVSSMKTSCNETRWKLEGKDSKIRELEERVRVETRSYNEDLEEKEAHIRQLQAKHTAAEGRAQSAELRVIDLREKLSLFRCNEALESTNKSIEQQHSQVNRLARAKQPIPPIALRNAELASARREKLSAVRDEQMAIYESQREAIKSDAIPLANLPTLSPPSLMEIMASTSLPLPRPMMPPMIPLPNRMPRMRLPMPMPQVVGAGGDGRPLQRIPEPHRVESPTPAMEQTPQSRRNAAESQLIQDVQNVFPDITCEDIRGYINKLRQSRQGQGLTGLKLVDLKRQIIELILNDSPARLSNAGNVVTHPGGFSRENSLDNDCTICHERMVPGQVRRLICNHVFHHYCIGDWLSRQNTCPVCRMRQP